MSALAEGFYCSEVEGLSFAQGSELAFCSICTSLAAVHAVERILQTGTCPLHLAVHHAGQKRTAGFLAFDSERGLVTTCGPHDARRRTVANRSVAVHAAPSLRPDRTRLVTEAKAFPTETRAVAKRTNATSWPA